MDLYYHNVVLFIKRIKNLAIFNGVPFIISYISTSLWGWALKWFMSELDNIKHGGINNDQKLGIWITNLLQWFKISTSMALGLLTTEAYFLKHVCCCRPSTQYIHTIIYYKLRCNIDNIANQLFPYRDLVPELLVFINFLTNTIKITDFIQVLKEKQEIWYDIFTV